jgi:hypothetical protein
MGHTKDLRTNTFVVYAQIPISEYMLLVGNDFDRFEIQRVRQRHRAYERMKKDIVSGALLPSITLAVDIHAVDQFIPLITQENYGEIASLLRSTKVNILDGLQRTYILQDLLKEHTFPEDHTLHAEFWFERNIYNLIYRIIILNAGQKPMSMRHQIEILFSTIEPELESRIPGLEIFSERMSSSTGSRHKRTGPKQYQLDRIAAAYQSYIIRDPEIDKQNVVAKQLDQVEGILENTEKDLGEQFERFQHYLNLYAQLDTEACRVYVGTRVETVGPDGEYTQIRPPSGIEWFGSENTMNSFFASVAYFIEDDEDEARLENALSRLLASLKSAQPSDDPLGLATYQQLIEGFPIRRVNVGVATRKLIFTGFYEYFRTDGKKNMSEIWRKAER